jgi:hypothetical protein
MFDPQASREKAVRRQALVISPPQLQREDEPGPFPPDYLDWKARQAKLILKATPELLA